MQTGLDQRVVPPPIRSERCSRVVVKMIVFSVLIISCPAYADDATERKSQGLSLRSDIPFEDNVHREYRVMHGLPSNTINDVLQTSDGFLWAATTNGLARFDGWQFKTFNRSNTPDFPANNVEKLYEDRDGTLWVGTEGGFARYRAGTIERIRALDDIRVMAIVQRRDGSICVGTEFDTWRSLDGNHFEPWKEVPNEARELFEDDNGTLWIGRRLQLFTYSNQEGLLPYRLSWMTNENTAWKPASGVPRIIPGEDGAMWIGTSQGLYEFRGGVFSLRLPGAVKDMLQTRTGGLYVQADFALCRKPGESFEMLERSPSTTCLAEDHEGGLWIGRGSGGGLHHVVHHPARHRFPDRLVYCMLEGADGEMWLGSNKGLLHWKREDEVQSATTTASAADPPALPQRRPRAELSATTTYSEEDGLPNLTVRALARGAGETIWVGTASGLCRLRGTELALQSQPQGLNELDIVALHESRDGALWIGENPYKTYRLFEGELEELTSLDEAGVKFFREDPDGHIWVGTNHGLYRQTEGSQFARVEDESFGKLLSSNFLCDYVDADGDWWMGTRGGLVLYRDGRFHVFTPGDGLASEYIERLHADASGENLWMGGRHGFFSVPRADLEEFIAGTRTSVRSQRLPPQYGSFVWRVGARCSPTTCLASDGNLWISDGWGILSLAPRPAYLDLPPPQVHIDSVRIDRQPADAKQRFEFMSGPRRLGVHFSAPTFVDPEHVKAQYRLEGHDEDWIDADSERIAFYTNIKPGDYQLRIRADNGYGAWNELSAPVAFTVNPHWWELLWLRVAAIVVAIVGSIGYFRMRLRKIKKSNDALRREILERKRAEAESRQRFEELARVSRAASMGELTTTIAHEVKQPITAIVSNAQTAQRLLGQDPPDTREAQEALVDIASDGNRAADIIDHIRSLVRKEDPQKERLDLNELAKGVVKLAEPDLSKQQVTMQTDLDSSLPQVDGDPIELQQVVLNLLVNGMQAMRESAGDRTLLLLTTSATNGSVELAVRDSGVGLDPSQAEKIFEPFFTTKLHGSGMGLAINRTIIEAHGGRIWADANSDRGATFRFSLPTSDGSLSAQTAG